MKLNTAIYRLIDASPNIKQYVKYKETDSNDIVDVYISTGGKASGKNNNCII